MVFVPINEKLKRLGISPRELGKLNAGKKKKFSIRKNRRCNNRCKMYEICWAKPFSRNKPFMTDKDGKSWYGKCALARMPKLLQNRTILLFKNDQDAFIKSMLNLLIEVELTIPKEQKLRLLYAYLRLYETIYGKKIMAETNVDGKIDAHELLIHIIGREEKLAAIKDKNKDKDIKIEEEDIIKEQELEEEEEGKVLC